MSTGRREHRQRAAAGGADAEQHSASFARRHWAPLSAGGLAVVVVAALVVLSAQRAAPAGTDPASSGAPAPAQQAAEDSGAAPGFSLATLDGQTVSVPAGRPGAIFFTVSSCVSCIAPAKDLADLKGRVGDRADVLLVSIDPSDSPQALRELGRLIGDPPYPSAIDTSGTLAAQYGVTALGTTVVYDRDGAIVARLIEPGADDLAAAFGQAGAL